MSGTSIDIVRRVLGDPTNPAVVNELVAEDAVYVSLNYEDDELKEIMPWAGTGHGRDALRKTFSDVARYWQIEEFDLGDVFGDGSGKVAVFGRMKYRSTFLGKTVSSPFAVYAKVADGKVVYAQFMEDSFATARSFRSGIRCKQPVTIRPPPTRSGRHSTSTAKSATPSARPTPCTASATCCGRAATVRRPSGHRRKHSASIARSATGSARPRCSTPRARYTWPAEIPGEPRDVTGRRWSWPAISAVRATKHVRWPA
jgi:uncharacterized protein